jgi:hypothetical protein
MPAPVSSVCSTRKLPRNSLWPSRPPDARRHYIGSEYLGSGWRSVAAWKYAQGRIGSSAGM